MSDDEDEYDIHDPRTREHTAYKISQENAIAAQKRFEEVYDLRQRNPSEGASDRVDREGVGREALEERLRNAKEARGWAHE